MFKQKVKNGNKSEIHEPLTSDKKHLKHFFVENEEFKFVHTKALTF